MLEIDGSMGEGGGQVLRSSLALSVVSGQPFRIVNIRARRKRPGLLRQHLTAVQAAARISSAAVEGAAMGSLRLEFRPAAILPGQHAFAVGTAGSTTLVFQTVLPALITAGAPSRLSFEGGTHNPLAPPFDFLEKCFLPLVNRMGPRVSATLERHGFYPAGGGRFTVEIEPAERLEPLQLAERGEVRRRRARVLIADLPRDIAEREAREVAALTGWEASSVAIEEVKGSRGPGNVILLEIESEHLTEVIAGFGERGVRAEAVARRAVEEARRYLKAGVPAGEHLADQLLIPMALAGSGSFSTLPLSRHSTTQIEVIRRFLEVDIAVERLASDQALVKVGSRLPPSASSVDIGRGAE
jgi:RNA 3'-terminal phosphate cyclase (ATP)